MKIASRRSFVKFTGAALGSSLVGAEFAFGGSDPVLSSVVSSVVKEATASAKRSCLYGARVTGEGPLVEVLAEVTNFENPSALADEVRVAGTTLSFSRDGITYSIRRVSSEEFDEAIAEIHSGAGQLFAHEAVSYDVAEGRLTDRFNQAASRNSKGKTELKPIGHECSPAEAFACVFDAAIDASLFGMVPSAASTALTSSVTRTAIHDIEEARTIVTETIDRVAAASETLESREVESWLASPMVDSSFRLVQGRSSRGFARAFSAVSSGLSQYDHASVWLALAAGAVNDGGAIHRALSTKNAFYADRTRAALAGATEILVGEMLPSQLSANGKGAGFDNWMSDHFGASATTVSDDLDGDGVPNLVEYALGGDPTELGIAPQPTLGSETIDGQAQLTLSYVRDTSLSDIDYVVQTSTTLDADSWTEEGITDAVVSFAEGLEARVARVNVTGSQRYLRLLVRQR